MTTAAQRTRMILQLIERVPVQTQDDLVAALHRSGIAVTQATVSRDMKRLGLVKVPGRDGTYRYALPGAAGRAPAPRAQEHLGAVMREFARSVDPALDLVLVKTVPGGAAPVAQAIDDAQWTEIAGTLAGEDTIIVVPRRKRAQRVVTQRLRALLGDW